MRYLLFGSTLSLLFYLGGCTNGTTPDPKPTEKPKSATATMECGSLGNFHSGNLGRINTPQVPFGQVFYVAEGSDRARPIQSSSPAQEDYRSEKLQSSDSTFEVELDVKVGGELTAEEIQEVEAEMKSRFGTKGEVILTNATTLTLNDSETFLNDDQERYQSALNDVKANPNSTVFVVHKVIKADELRVQSTKESANSISLDLTGIGRVNVAVNYKCNELQKLTGGSVFFKATPFKLYREDGREPEFASDGKPPIEYEEVKYVELVAK